MPAAVSDSSGKKLLTDLHLDLFCLASGCVMDLGSEHQITECSPIRKQQNRFRCRAASNYFPDMDQSASSRAAGVGMGDILLYNMRSFQADCSFI